MESLAVTTDVFRCSEFGMQSVAENARWLRGLLHNVFSAPDFALSVFVSACDGGPFQVARYRRTHDLPGNACGWATLVNSTIPERDESLFAHLLKARLVVGWGLTPALMQLLDRHDIEFVDVEVDPIRFGEDLFLHVRTNSRHLRNYFSSVHVEDATFISSAAEIRAFVSRLDPAAAQEHCTYGLFAGQCFVDLSVVKNGRLATPEDFIEEIQLIASDVDVLLVKSHPYDTNARHIEAVLDAIPNAMITHSHIYRILSDVNLKHVVALSSSVLDEAGVFGVPATRLINPDREASTLIPMSLSPWYRISADRMTDRNLASALKGASYRANFSEGRFNLRRSLNTNWGLPQLYSAPKLPLKVEARRPGPNLTRRDVVAGRFGINRRRI